MRRAVIYLAALFVSGCDGTPPAPGPVSSAPATEATPSLPAVQVGAPRAEGDFVLYPVAETNDTGEALPYLEVQCAFYDAGGALSGTAFQNWTNVAAGETVSGSVGIEGVGLARLARADCHARTSI